MIKFATEGRPVDYHDDPSIVFVDGRHVVRTSKQLPAPRHRKLVHVSGQTVTLYTRSIPSDTVEPVLEIDVTAWYGNRWLVILFCKRRTPVRIATSEVVGDIRVYPRETGKLHKSNTYRFENGRWSVKHSEEVLA